MKSICSTLLPFLILSGLLNGSASASTLYGNALAGFSTFYSVDQITGARTPIAPLGSGQGQEDLASDWRPESYRIWAVHNGSLASVDPTNGSLTTIGALPANVRAIAYDVTTNELYGVGFGGLYKIDTATGAGTFIGTQPGDLGYPSASLGSDAIGNLYAYRLSTNSIVNINKTTGTYQSLGPTGPSTIALNDLATRPEDGVMYGVSDQLSATTSFTS
jgi:hypothetical protein